MHLLSYIGPDQLIPLATPIAIALGFVLMCGRNLGVLVVRLARIVVNPRKLFAGAERGDAAPQVVAFSISDADYYPQTPEWNDAVSEATTLPMIGKRRPAERFDPTRRTA